MTIADLVARLMRNAEVFHRAMEEAARRLHTGEGPR